MGGVPMSSKDTALLLGVFFLGLIAGAILENNYGNEQYGALEYVIAFMSACGIIQLMRPDK
jgi:hypothetical protein